MLPRLIGLALTPLLLVLLTVAASPRWALLQLIAIYAWLLPLLVARWWQSRRPPPDRDRAAEWFLSHRAVPFILYIYVFATLLFGLVAFVASVFGPATTTSLGWVLAVTVSIAAGVAALVWRAQVTSWVGRTRG
jgi:hypothetical protein